MPWRPSIRPSADREQPPPVEGCPCCTTPAEFEKLAAKPLRELNADDLGRYARKAMTTVGHTAAFRYFLPRILELSVEDQLPVDREVVFGKLRYGKWREWPLYEQEAIERLSKAIAATFGTTIYAEWDVDEWVCALGQYSDNLPELLQPLLGDSPASKANVAALVELNTGELGGVELVNGFWDDRTPNTAVFLDWLRRPDVRVAGNQ